MLEHFADGDLFSCDLEPGWAPMSASGLAQWGPPVTRDFLGTSPSPAKLPRGHDGPARRQRTRPRTPAGPDESDELMSTNVLRTADGWWVVRDERAVRVETKAVTTAELLADRDAVREAAASAESGTPVADLVALPPVTTPCRVVAQMVNYRSHAKDSGFTGDIPPTFFRKASGSVSGPHESDRPPRAREVPRLRGGTRPRHGRDPARGHRRRGAGPAALRRRPCPDQRRQRPRRPADQDPVLREQVLSDLHADGAVPGPAGARGLRPSARTCGCGCRSTACRARTARWPT